MEEMNELGKIICKILRQDLLDYVVLNQELYEEIADVEIMIEQAKSFFECKKDVDLIKTKKLKRLEKRMYKIESNNP